MCESICITSLVSLALHSSLLIEIIEHWEYILGFKLIPNSLPLPLMAPTFTPKFPISYSLGYCSPFKTHVASALRDELRRLLRRHAPLRDQAAVLPQFQDGHVFTRERQNINEHALAEWYQIVCDCTISYLPSSDFLPISVPSRDIASSIIQYALLRTTY